MLRKPFRTVHNLLVKSRLFVFLRTKPVITEYSEFSDDILKEYGALEEKSKDLINFVN